MNAAPSQSLLPEPIPPATVDALHEFASFVNGRCTQGRNVLCIERKYFSRAAQRAYWTPEKIRAVQRPLLVTDPETIQREYLGVYSMLAYSNKVNFLKLYFLSPALRDDLFPLYRQPGEEKWPAGEIAERLYEAVEKHQYRFFPLVLNRHHLDDRRIKPSHILPISEMKLLRPGNVGKASVYKITVDPEYNELVPKGPDGRPIQNTFALKVQPSRSFHNNEVTAFTHFKNYPSAHIIGYYGSFIQSEKYCLILEYVDGGNLESYLQKTPPPKTPEDRLKFWQSYSGFLKGIHGVHQVNHPPDDGQLKGLHGDMKPDNMLLKMGPSGSPYDFIPKVADFGYSHFRRVETDAQDRRGLDRHGNQQYCAPEASHHTKWLEIGPNRIDFPADIFSFGAITDEVLVWMAYGSQEIDNYFHMRKEATDRLNPFEGSGYGGCFHDGLSPLSVIRLMHQRIRKDLPPDDQITRKMVGLVENGMLLGNPHERWSAMDLQKRFDICYQEAAEMMLPRSALPSSPTSARAEWAECDITWTTNLEPSPIRPVLGSHARSISVETLESVPSPFTEPSLGSPFRTLERPMSASTLDGVYNQHGGTICSAPCQLCDLLPEQSRAAMQTLSVDIPSDSATNEPSGSSSTTPKLRESTGTLQHLTVNGQRGQSGRNSQSSVHGRPALTLDQLREYWQHRKQRSEVPAHLEVDIRKLQKYIQRRDHIFYIDDSESMRRHKLDCEDAFSVMSYVAKEVDTDGIEVYFGSNPTRVVKKTIGTGTTPLLRRLRCQNFDEPSDKMSQNFDQFVRRILVPRLSVARKELSVLVFTNGIWGEDTERAAGVEEPVKHLIQNIVERDLPPTRIMLSFVQFGNDQDGQRRLKYLDDCGKQEIFPTRLGVKKMCDNVDTGPITGNICKLFIGSLIPGNDDDDTDIRPRSSFTLPP